MEQPTEAEVVARVEERPDLVERIAKGDSGAIVELLEHATGAKAASVKVMLPGTVAPAGLEVWAWVGEDELGSGEVGLKQADVPAGRIPLVAIDRAKLDRAYIRTQLGAQAVTYGKPIRLARFVEVPYPDPVELRPETAPPADRHPGPPETWL